MNCKVDEQTGLHIATYNGDFKMAKFLLKNRADPGLPDSQGKTPLRVAVEIENTQLASLLLLKGAEPIDKNLLIIAVEKGNLELVKLLLNNGAKPDSGNAGVKEKTALHAAVEGGNKDLIVELLKNGAKVNLRNEVGKTSLHLAIEKMDKELVVLLLENWADPSIRDDNGQTAADIDQKNRKSVFKHLAERCSACNTSLVNGYHNYKVSFLLDFI